MDPFKQFEKEKEEELKKLKKLSYENEIVTSFLEEKNSTFFNIIHTIKTGHTISGIIDFWKRATISDIEKYIKKYEINKIDRYGLTPLMWASIFCNNEEIIWLFERESDDKITLFGEEDRYGWTPLMLACRYNKSFEVIEAILECSSCNTGKENIGRSTCLILAIYSKQPYKLVKLLIEKGSKYNINLKNKFGDTPLLLASQPNFYNLDIIRLLIENGAKINERNVHGDTPLMIELKSRSHNLNETLFLIENGADICAENFQSISPLKYILKRFSNSELTDFLTIGNKKISQSQLDEMLKVMVENRDIDLYKLDILIKNGANLNIKYKNNLITDHTMQTATYHESLLMITIRDYEDLSFIEYLLKNEVDVNYQNEFGNTAFHYTAEYCTDIEVLKLLIKYGADTGLKTNDGSTPLIIAVKNEKSDINIYRHLYNTPDSRGYEFIKFIIDDRPEYINCQNNNGNTAISLITKNLMLIELLLNHGADPDIKNNDGSTIASTILNFALSSYHEFRENYIKILIFLLKYGINPNIQCSFMGNLIFAAAEKKDKELVKLILNYSTYPVDIYTKSESYHKMSTLELIQEEDYSNNEIKELILQYKNMKNI